MTLKTIEYVSSTTLVSIKQSVYGRSVLTLLTKLRDILYIEI